MLPSQKTGLNKIECSLPVSSSAKTPAKSAFEYFIDIPLLEKNSGIKTESVKSIFFKNQEYYNFQNSKSFINNFRNFIKPIENHYYIDIISNIYFMCSCIFFFCLQWFLLKKTK